MTSITKEKKILINEIYYSIQGEGSYTGYPCIFIRTTGCNLRCKWCDSEFSFYEGTNYTFPEIIKFMKKYPNNSIIEITGGEPLLQKNIYNFIDYLKRNQRKSIILLETSGSIIIDKLQKFVHVVLDLKSPSSQEESSNKFENLLLLKNTDDLKIVIADKKDFLWAESIVCKYNINEKRKKPTILQPEYNSLNPKILAEWIKKSKLSFKLGLQLHKYIYFENERKV